MSPSPQPGIRWSNSQLDAMRQIQDPAADAVIREIFFSGQVNAVNQLMQALVQNDGLPPEALPKIVVDYLASTGGLPGWADPAKIEAGERIFWRYGPAILSVLQCYSLPFCYAARKGVQVLALTSRLYSNPTRRILETAQLVVDVMRPGGLGHLGSGIRTAQKVRLMHAGVRFQIAHSNQWNPEWDAPINQEDMAVTLLTFSYIILDGLRRLGYHLTDDEADAYFHSWNCVGHIMGISPDLIAHDYADGANLAARTAERQFASCPEGQMMTAALIGMARHIIPGDVFDNLPAFLVRYLGGDHLADLLGVDKSIAGDLAMAPVRILARLRGDLMRDLPELARIHELFARALIHGALFVARGGKRPPLSIPTELLQTWGLNWQP